MTDDIVVRLRRDCMSLIADEAADEIERLRELSGDSGQLRKERDEARRMWCEAAPVGNSLSVDDMDRRARTEAKRRGWDCYKENTNND